MRKSRIAAIVLLAAITGTADTAPSELPRRDRGSAKAVVARPGGGGTAQPAKRAPAPKRVAVQEAGCGEIGLRCLEGDDIACIKFWLCKAKHDTQVW
ncbi:MAG TPA: hypothetical protein VEK57_13995 [Thermoanaerobaculia bacterium]|nr:hypothetical protein [Thermoanaerobaculia bacterium]